MADGTETHANRAPPRRQPRAAPAGGPPAVPWWRGPVLLGLIIVLGFACLQVLWLLARPLGLLLAAVVIAAALAPLVDWLARWLPRTLAIFAVYLAVLLAVGGIGWLLIPPLVSQAQNLVTAAPDLIEEGQGWLDRWDVAPLNEDQVAGAAQSVITGLGSFLVSLPLRILSATLEIVLVFAMSAYLVAAGPALHRFAMSLLPVHHRRPTSDVLAEMGRTMGGFVRGTLIDAAIVGALVYAGMLLLGVRFAVVLALVSAVGELFPTIGPILAAIPAVGIALLDSPTQALIVLAFYVAVQQLETHLLLPLIMRNQADVPPTLAIFAVLAGGYALGILGALIAIPIAGALRILVLRVVAPYVRRRAGAPHAG